MREEDEVGDADDGEHICLWNLTLELIDKVCRVCRIYECARPDRTREEVSEERGAETP